MQNLNELKITNKDYDLETGFFWVEFSNGRSLQCCLKQYGNDEDGYFFKPEVEIDNCGYDDGISADNNEWAVIHVDGCEEWGHIHDFLIEQARSNGLEIVA